METEDGSRPFDLTSRVALVTGAGGGLGRAIARCLAVAGADLALHDLQRTADVVETRKIVEQVGGKCEVFAADVRDARRVEGVVAAVRASLGEIDILVNNAGVMTEVPFLDLSEEEWRQTLDVNLTGVFLCSKAVAPSMVSRGHGSIINMASQLAQKGVARTAHYSAAKGGILALTRSMAADLGPQGVRVNAVAPGPVDTPMLDPYRDPAWNRQRVSSLVLERIARPEEVAPSVLFLASDEGSLYVGQTLCPNGGGVMP